MNLTFTSTKTVPSNTTVSLFASVCEQPTPANSLSITDLSSTYYGNTITKPQLYNDSDPPIVDGDPYDTQIVISDKVIYSNLDDIDTIVLGYEYQLKFDHYDKGNPSGTIQLCYLGGEPIPNVMYKLEACTDTTMWEDYRDNGAAMTPRYDDTLSWSPVTSDATVYRIRVLLPESICFTGSTLCVMYTKVHPHSGATTDESHVSVGYIEVVNPKSLS